MEQDTKSLIVGIILVLISFIGIAYLSSELTMKKYEKIMERNMFEFQSGFTDATIQRLSQMITDCTPENVEVFNWITLDNKHQGVIFKCDKTNVTHGMHWSPLRPKYLEVKGGNK